jgi:xanthosine utilization system XapX-like protein
LWIALGRNLWDMFAKELYAVPDPAMPVVAVILVAVGGIVLANLVASIPGQLAARTPAALALRAE